MVPSPSRPTFPGVKPLHEATRMTNVAEQIHGMTEEEVYHCLSKVTHSPKAGMSQRALESPFGGGMTC